MMCIYKRRRIIYIYRECVENQGAIWNFNILKRQKIGDNLSDFST